MGVSPFPFNAPVLDAPLAQEIREVIAEEVASILGRDRLFKGARAYGNCVFVEWGAYKDIIRLEVIGPGSEKEARLG